MAASGMGLIFATPYATRYTLPGLVPVIAELSTQMAYEHNAIAYSRRKKRIAIEQHFIAIVKAKICSAPLLQPLCSARWIKLKTLPYDSADFQDFAWHSHRGSRESSAGPRNFGGHSRAIRL